MLALSPERQAAVDQATFAQQGALAEAYGTAIGRTVVVGGGKDVVEATQAAMSAALAAQLRDERLPRIVIAAILAVLPAVVLFLRRGRVVAWLLAGAVIYIVLFNLRYAVLSGRTYSLSSVTSSGDLISFVALTALAAFVLGWLAVAWRLLLFRGGPGRAAGLSVALALTTIYLLALPFLWSFALNGLFVTWALPDFASMFVALLSGIQMLAVAASGVILAGVAALIAWLATRSSARR
jgi:hypothetical protein